MGEQSSRHSASTVLLASQLGRHRRIKSRTTVIGYWLAVLMLDDAAHNAIDTNDGTRLPSPRCPVLHRSRSRIHRLAYVDVDQHRSTPSTTLPQIRSDFDHMTSNMRGHDATLVLGTPRIRPKSRGAWE